MRTIKASSLCLLAAHLLLSANPQELIGQRVTDLGPYGAGIPTTESGPFPDLFSPPGGAAAQLSLPGSARNTRQEAFPAPPSGHGWQSRILTSLAGAAVGMGLGYFASEVATSDWTESSRSGEANRALWAGVGGGVGLALGFSFPIFGSAGQGGSFGAADDSRAITAEDLQKIVAFDALEAVRLLRPDWLVERGQEAFYDPESDNIVAYLDDMRLGGVEVMREISTSIIESIQWVNANRALARWGAGHTQGVIQIITKD